MSRRKVLTAIGIVSAAGAVIPTVALTQSGGRPDLVVSASAEPPDFEVAGGRFRAYFTVSNQTRADADDSSRARAWLSTDRRRERSDIALGTRATPAIPGRSQATRMLLARIPESTPPGFYHFIICADTGNAVRESRERNNCFVSGQQVGINSVRDESRGPAGPPGAPGADGPQGERGDPGPGYGLRRVAKVQLDPGEPNIDDEAGSDTGGDPDEGSTSRRDLLTVGPLTFRALCRQEPDAFEGDENTEHLEAKVIVVSDSGTMSLRGANGPRGNVGPGLGTAGEEGADGGEGKRQLAAVDRGGGDPGVFRRATGFVAHSDGTFVSVQGLYAGIEVAGGDDETCVFGGLVRVIEP